MMASNLSEEDRIREAMELTQKEWGVNLKNHSRFCQKALNRALKYTQREKDTNPLNMAELENNHLPVDPIEAVRHVLTTVVDETVLLNGKDKWKITTDRLGIGCFSPFYQDMEGKMRLCRDFRAYRKNMEALDPFARLIHKRYDNPADFSAHTWNGDSVGGQVLEAMVACHLEHKKACFNCETEGSMRWNGGFGVSSAWADVVCVRCFASYEIKTKRDQEAAIKNMVKHDSVSGGSFLAFSKFKPLGQRCLVMVPRTPRHDDYGKYHPVTIAEIDQVLPTLTDKSFDLRSIDAIMIKSKVFVKAGTRKTWCMVPASPLSDHVEDLARSVFDSKFGKGEWDRRRRSGPGLP